MARNKPRHKQRRDAGQVQPAMSAAEAHGLGAAQQAHQAGHMAAAEQAYRQVLALNPRNAAALHLYGVLSHQRGQHAEALALMERALAADPRNPGLHNNRGEVLRALGRLEAALASYRQATRLAPEFAEAWNNAALALAALGRLEDAERHARRVVKLAPTVLAGHMVLAEVLWARQDPAGCQAACEGALALQPDCAEALFKLGLCQLATGQSGAARGAFEGALLRAPGLLQARLALVDLDLAEARAEAAWAQLEALAGEAGRDAALALRVGRCLAALQRHGEAVVALRSAVQGLPDDIDAAAALAVSEAQSGELEAGLARLGRLAAQAGRADLFISLGRLQAASEHADLAQASFEQALALQPDNAEALRGRAEMLLAAGDLDGARSGLLAAIDSDPTDAYGYASLAAITRRADWPPARFAALQALGDDPTLDDAERAAALFAVAQLLDGDGDPRGAIAPLQRANALMAARLRFDVAAHVRFVDAIIETFDDLSVFDLGAPGAAGERPIFIVGMPRSGTSLVEQILASHAAVAGAGEVEFFSHLRFRDGGSYPRACRRLRPADAEALRARYLARLAAADAQAARVTDKMPSNFLYLGLIHLLFPGAPVVHCRRDAMDTGVSIYFQNFTAAAGNAYAFDLAHIGAYHRQYQRLMSHWQARFGEQVFTLDYEALVAEPRPVVEALLTHLGLPWDEACLNFHRSTRAVHTASQLQVRQPLYRSSVARWRRYGEALAPLAAALAADPVETLPRED